MPQKFDIVYAPTVLAPPVNCHVMVRDVEALDRAHALLWWIRTELGLKVDPVEMFDEPYRHEPECGCEFFIEFDMERLGRIARLRAGESAVPTAEIECEPCDQHAADDFNAPESSHREWNGTFAAWVSDAKRPDTFVHS